MKLFKRKSKKEENMAQKQVDVNKPRRSTRSPQTSSAAAASNNNKSSQRRSVPPESAANNSFRQSQQQSMGNAPPPSGVNGSARIRNNNNAPLPHEPISEPYGAPPPPVVQQNKVSAVATAAAAATPPPPPPPPPAPAAAPPPQQQVDESNQASIDLTRSLVKKFIADIWNRGEIDLIPSVCSPSLRFNGNTGFDRVGHDGLARMVATIRDALDDYHCEIHSMVVEHNKAFCRLRFTGKHTGNLLGYPPTGRTVAWMGATEFTCQHGKILKVWELGDIKTLEEQLITMDQPMDGNVDDDDDDA